MFAVNLGRRAMMLAALAWMAAPGAASATTLIHTSVEELTTVSTLIVRGTVTSLEAGEPTPGRIDTAVEVTVAEVLKGIPRGKVTVVTPGGRLGNLSQRVEGAATFKLHEAVLLFLVQVEGHVHAVTAMSQGKFTLDAQPGSTIAVPQSPGSAHLIDLHRRPAQPTPPMALETLRGRIRAALKGGAR
jgi:hypothetical protein